MTRLVARRGVLVGVVTALGVLGACGGSDPPASAQARASAVMGVDVGLLTYEVAPSDRGGSVTVRVAADFASESIQDLRDHLRAQQARFRRGDLDVEREIHGDDTPGLDVLERGHARVAVSYVDLPDGGTLTFRTDDSRLVAALHQWLDRVVSDFADRLAVTTTRPPETAPAVPPGLLG